ncbi:amino acid adenylation domain-containing protein [Brevibacillus sp. SYP-B805]|uniref:non-ribosomal peptide synthetase family protein n=1 Tax=Brevibacillus sp. SYP-B805 TaxID=1578199 RepID=UPI0013EAEC49|nr:amino acid adenylation domain-containing protein [Brevibacillus sp. SYP-B805]NGQ96170.1 amino acid adenylation domain-containing protein [Brevibacillus sp. SYP-B805]
MTNQPEACFHQMFEKRAEQDPDRIALLLNEEALTYGELNRRANQLARHLITRGVSTGTLVGISFERSFDMIVSMLAVFKAGAAYVPLDPEYPRARLAYILEDTNIRYLLTTEAIHAALPANGAAAILLDRERARIAALPDTNPDVAVRPGDLAYVIYTSGSTGKPKGVMLEHAGLANMSNEQVRIFQIQPEDRVIQASSLCFDASIFEIVLALRAGAALCLIPQQNSQVGVGLYRFLKQYRITCATLVPSVLNLLPPEELPELKTIISAGEACTSELVDRWATGGRRFFNAYGPTETTVWATIETCAHGAGKPSIGVPIRHTVAYILDEQLREVPVGEVGELYLGGVHVARGYLNNPALTAERFIPNPFAEEGAKRLYKTGDLARRRPDGKIEFLGRADQLIKVRGFRIDPSEIEDAISKHPAIKQTHVMAREDGASRQKLVAYLVTKERESVTIPEMKAFLKELLPHYMVPSHYVYLPVLPLTPNGKVDRASLPDPADGQQEKGGSSAGDTLEEELQRIWCDIFGKERVERNAHFFDDLFGDSLTGMDLMLRMEKQLKVELPIRVLFEAPTIETLAEAIRRYRHDHVAAAGEYGQANVNLDEEAQLDTDIVRLLEERARPSSGEQLLLTGVTGFLGSHLLRELLDRTDARVYCLVRAGSKEEGLQRIQAALQKYQVSQRGLETRVEAVPGDLSLPLLGLSPTDFAALAVRIDAIYHCAALVNFVYPYSRLKKINVHGTREIIRLAASGKTKTLHHISSLAVYGSVGYFHHPLIPEDELDHIHTLHMGYAESKAVSEKLVAAAGKQGLPICIYRLDDVIGHSQTGLWNTDDFICRFLKGCIQLGLAPDLDIRMNAVPVDVVSRIIVHLSGQQDLRGKACNIFNPASIYQQEMFAYFADKGYKINQIPFAEWQRVLVEKVSQQKENALYPLIPLFTERYSEHQLTLPQMYEEARRPRFSAANTMKGLQGSGIQFPKWDGPLFERYYRYFLESGFLREPGFYPAG